MIQRQQPIQQFTAGGFGDGETNALFGVVEAVIQGEVLPAIRSSHGVIHFDVQIPQLLNVRGAVVGVVKAIVGRGQAFPPRVHDALAVRVIAFADGVEVGEIEREGEGFKAVGWGVANICPHS